MGKSLGNAYTLHDLSQKGFDPLDLRYFYLSGHYRKQLNFTFDALRAAKTALAKLRGLMANYKGAAERTVLSNEKNEKVRAFQDEFREALESDLNMPQALAVTWEVVKSNIPDYDKYDLLINFDEVLGLGLSQATSIKYQVSPEVQELLDKREELRKAGKFEEADKIRGELKRRGVSVADQPLE
jgi:cysteinyl-tRNA synthetase